MSAARPTRRERWITAMRIAGYHDDSRAYTRLLCEAHVNRAVLNKAFMAGGRARAAGVGCTCLDCQPTAEQRVALGSPP